MGQEAKCQVRFNGRVSDGKALLETDELIFRGDFRLAIPYKGIRSLEDSAGALRVAWEGGDAAFLLGPLAEKWAYKIRNPRTLLDKLDVKPGLRVSLVGVELDVAARTSDVTKGKAAPNSDLIFFAASAEKDLDKLPALRKNLQPAGAIWVVYPKGRKEITEIGVLNAGRQTQMVDTKIARFSETHTAHKFVIPVEQRGAQKVAKARGEALRYSP